VGHRNRLVGYRNSYRNRLVGYRNSYRNRLVGYRNIVCRYRYRSKNKIILKNKKWGIK